jgi:hypothetical protein
MGAERNMTSELSQGMSAMSLYGGHGSGSSGLGMDTANQLSAYEMSERQRMVAPTQAKDGNRPGDLPEWYNTSAPPPAKYTVPSEMKERMVAKAAIRDAAGKATHDRVPRPDPITDLEVDYLQMMKKQGELADFDRYISTLVDPRKPGNLKWLMEVYPEYVHRRVSQVHDDYDFAIRNQMIDQWGVNTFDDLHFKYLVDQKKISGPLLSRRDNKEEGYQAGWLAPYKMFAQRRGGVQYPFSSANYGKKPSGGSWTQSDDGQPLGGGRGLQEMATEVMAKPSAYQAGPNRPSRFTD